MTYGVDAIRQVMLGADYPGILLSQRPITLWEDALAVAQETEGSNPSTHPKIGKQFTRASGESGTREEPI